MKQPLIPDWLTIEKLTEYLSKYVSVINIDRSRIIPPEFTNMATESISNISNQALVVTSNLFGNIGEGVVSIGSLLFEKFETFIKEIASETNSKVDDKDSIPP